MGIDIEREDFDEDAYARFSDKLEEQLVALRSTLARPEFGRGAGTLGVELEVNLVGPDARPMPANAEVLARTTDPRIVPEIDRHNLELNSRPVDLAGRPFTALGEELESGLAEMQRCARTVGGRVALVGILPTIERDHLAAASMTDKRRYRALAAGLRRARPTPMRVRIDEGDGLDVDVESIALEGANTSFQIHLRVDPDAYARTYNAAQIATAVALAAGANSPTFLGRRLWDETRVALFRQSVDDRPDGELEDWRPARVSFGHGWVRRGALELFEESVAHHVPLLPALAPHADDGPVPRLEELRLHHGTVWRWNRAVYDPAGDGHLRIELRALPAGPTVLDMLASAAFLVGLTLGLAPDAESWVTRLTHGQARRNFYEAARRGLDAELLWPGRGAPSVRPIGGAKLALDLLPIARRGLVDAGVDPAEADALLTVIEARVARGASGARWQRRALDTIGAAPRAAARMLERYLEHAASGAPVHTWPSMETT